MPYHQIISPFSRGDRCGEAWPLPLNPPAMWLSQFSEKIVAYPLDEINLWGNTCPACQYMQPLQAFLRPFLPTTTWREATESVRRGEHTLPTKTYEASALRLDIADFTELMDNHSLDQLLTALNTCFARLIQVVHYHNGDIHKFLGDGFLALFNSADEAVMAGCAIQQIAIAFNRRQAAEKGIIFPTRLAIDTGPVVLTNIGSPDRQDRTVMGMPVNLAERLQAEATPGRVWLSQATFEQLSDPSGCRCLGPVEVKGKQAPVIVYEKL